MYVMVAGQLRSSVTITECVPSIRVLKIADLTNNAHSEVLWLTEVIHAQLKRSAPWTLFKFTYKRWSISMYLYIHWERERSSELTRDMVSHRLVKTFSWFRRVSHVHRTLNPDFVSLLGANSLFWQCHDKLRGLFPLLLKWWACSQVKIYLLPWGKCLTNIAILNND